METADAKLLPAEKVASILDDIKHTTRKGWAPLQHLQHLQGYLIHASYAIPNGKAFLSPLVSLIAHQLPNTCKHILLDATIDQLHPHMALARQQVMTQMTQTVWTYILDIWKIHKKICFLSVITPRLNRTQKTHTGAVEMLGCYSI